MGAVACSRKASLATASSIFSLLKSATVTAQHTPCFHRSVFYALGKQADLGKQQQLSYVYMLDRCWVQYALSTQQSGLGQLVM